MGWRAAFLTQARSDNEVRKLLNKSLVPYAHQLHYLQMTTEKLATGFSTSPSAISPQNLTHSAFVSCLRAIKGRPEIRRQLGYTSSAAFSSFIDALLPLALSVEQLASKFAGTTKPNPEYPWQPTPAHEVIAPAEFDFPEFEPTSAMIVQLVNLVEQLPRVVV